MSAGRREFIRRSLLWILGFLGLGAAAAGIRTLSPLRGPAKALAFFPLLSEDEVPRRGVRKAELVVRSSGREQRTRVFVVSGPDGVAVLSAVCSHLGCLVNYRRDRREFVCPCHGGRYDIDGRNIAGPPPAPLTRFPVKMDQGMLLVGIKV